MASETDKKDRSHLPIASRERTGPIVYDARDSQAAPPRIERLRPPAGAPNVLIVPIDDAGFGSSSAFGGPCQRPNSEKLAAGGLKYNRFHTTALCSPTRQALLTGRNHPSCGMAGVTEIATSHPGYGSVLPNTIAPQVKLYTDGKQVGEGHIPATLAMLYSVDEGCDVGEDSGAPVSPAYGPRGNGFNGRIKGVQLDISGAESVDHLVKPEDAIRIALAQQ